jgi:uncharacterized protein YutE (UPF0331/DUF86 family)
MGIDLVIIERRLIGIMIEVEFLKTVKTQDLKNFLRDDKSVRATSKAIETVAQCVIDISSHIIAQNHWGVSDSYRQSIATLSMRSVISENLASQLQSLIAMRNILVHQYLDADYQIVWESVDSVIRDSRAFVDAIKRYLEEIDY